MAPAQEMLELLLPGAEERSLKRARDVVRFLRLLSDDSSSTRATAVGVGLEEARDELELHDRMRVEEALSDLMAHHLRAVAETDTFVAWVEPTLGYQDAWRALDEFRDEIPGLASVPGLGESPFEVAARLIDSLAALGASVASVLLWRAQFTRFAEGPRPAETLLRTGLASSTPRGPRPRSELQVRRRSIAFVAQCLLDRGSVREARDWLTSHGVLVDGDPCLRQLLSWSFLGLGDFAGAKSAIVGLPPWCGPIPERLVELRSHRPEWMPCLAGKFPVERVRDAGGVDATRRERDRGEIGACVLAVFVLRPAGVVEAIELDVAPGLRQGVESWLQERDGACTVAGEREHELVVRARPVVVRADGGSTISGTLGREAVLAVALAPILDAEGEVAGWLHVEFEHHLPPTSARLLRIAGSWSREVLGRRSAPTESPVPRVESAPGPEVARDPVEGRGAAAAGVFEALVGDLGIKTAQRRWWGFVLEAGDLVPAARGGEAAGLSEHPDGRGRGLSRALATKGRVSFEEPDANLALDDRAASGVVLPLSAGGELCGLLAIESSRRRDFRGADWVRHAQTVESCGLALRLAGFRNWHLDRYGFEVWFDARRDDFRTFALPLLAAARSRSPIVLAGPAGCGKTILARWIHFEGRGRPGPIHVVGCGSTEPGETVADWIDAAGGGTLVLEEVETLPRAHQEELLRVLEGEGAASTRSSATRILASTRHDLGRAVDEDRLRIDLAHRLDRLQFRIPALRERREDVLPLVGCLARRFADEEGLPAPRFEDEAMALLWRQTWKGNVRELESFVYKLVLLSHFEAGRRSVMIDASRVRDMARRFSMSLVRRIPSRHPSRADLVAALRATRLAGGRLNKTRAALFLGWDPDTLVLRMRDANIGEEVGDTDVWSLGAGIESDPLGEDPEDPTPDQDSTDAGPGPRSPTRWRAS